MTVEKLSKREQDVSFCCAILRTDLTCPKKCCFRLRSSLMLIITKASFFCMCIYRLRYLGGVMGSDFEQKAAAFV